MRRKMLDAFIIDRIKDEEKRREERRPMLRLPVYIDEGCGRDQAGRVDEESEKKVDEVVIDFS